MRVIYDDASRVIIVKIEDLETVTTLNTTDIAEARKWFLQCMEDMFNNAVISKLKN